MARITSSERKLLVLMIIGISVAAFAFAAAQVLRVWTTAKYTVAPFRVTVEGEGKVDARSNVTSFTASVVTSASDAKEAEQKNSRKVAALVSFLKQNGIEEKDIKTQNFSIYPQYQYFDTPPCILEPTSEGITKPCPPYQPSRIWGYEVRNSVEVKVRDLAKVSELLRGVITAGASEVYGPSFSIEQSDALKTEARRKAIENARQKAQTLARDLNVRFGRVVDFHETSGDFPIYARAFEGGGGGAPLPPIEPGSEEVRISVSITYELK